MIALLWKAVLGMLLLGSLLSPRVEGGHETAWQRLPDGPRDFSLISGTLSRDGRVYMEAYRYTPFRVALMAYDLRRQTWTDMGEPPIGGDLLVAVGSSIYEVGGDAAYQDTGYTYRDDLQSGTWSFEGSTLCAHTTGAANLGADGRIYLVAGDQLDLLGVCAEAYTPKTQSWAWLARLPLGLSSPAITSGPDGRIYVLGGVTEDYSGSHFFATNRVEAYDPRTYGWTTVAPMPTARAGLAAVTGTDGRIYAIGGSPDPISLGPAGTPTHRLGTVEAYDPRTNRWSRLPSLHLPRYGLTAVMGPDGKIYAIGPGAVVETYQVPLPARG